jgi:Carbamoyl-phosphate synthase L chain, ATP binding domain
MQAMGDKTMARQLANECEVPIVMGIDEALESLEEAHAFAMKAGFPIMMKAAMGGGGRGMRVVRSGNPLKIQRFLNCQAKSCLMCLHCSLNCKTKAQTHRTYSCFSTAFTGSIGIRGKPSLLCASLCLQSLDF